MGNGVNYIDNSFRSLKFSVMDMGKNHEKHFKNSRMPRRVYKLVIVSNSC